MAEYTPDGVLKFAEELPADTTLRLGAGQQDNQPYQPSTTLRFDTELPVDTTLIFGQQQQQESTQRALTIDATAPAPESDTTIRQVEQLRLDDTAPKPHSQTQARRVAQASIAATASKPNSGIYIGQVNRAQLDATITASQANIALRRVASAAIDAQAAPPHSQTQLRRVASAQIAAQTAAPDSGIALRRVAEAQIHAAAPAAQSGWLLEYDKNVFRGDANDATDRWAEGRDLRPRAALAWQESRTLRQRETLPWQPARDVNARATIDFTHIPQRNRHYTGAWAAGVDVDAGLDGGWTHPPDLERRHGGRWARGIPVDTQLDGHWHSPPDLEHWHGGRWAEAQDITGWPRLFAYSQGLWRPISWIFPWAEAIQPRHGHDEPIQPPITPEPPDYRPNTLLRFCGLMPGAPWVLRFGIDPCDRGDFVIPTRRTYLVTNNAQLTRVSDGAQIPAQQIEISIDIDSWAWGMNATLAGPDAQQLIHEAGGQPVVVEANINGETWRVLVDSWRHNRRFGSRSISLQGRSLAAYLAAPYARARSFASTQARTAQQLANREMPFGWQIDWNLDIWLVPPGAYGYQASTPIEAVTRIAQAAGGYVQAAQADKRLHLLERYPVASWDWDNAAPDITIPTSIITDLGRDWQPREDANVVYLSGRDQGVLVGATRDGTAGDKPLPMVVDPLITEVSVARARAKAELSAMGEQSRQTLAMPLSDDTNGLVANGSLVQITGDGADWRGMVRAVSVQATRENNALSVRQNLDIERHAA